MSENNQEKRNKLITFAKDKDLAIFDELQELNSSIKELIDITEESGTEDVNVSNLDEITTDLTPLQGSFEALIGSIDGVLDSISERKEIDMSGVEKLLTVISNKESKDVDMSELSNISEILSDVLFAVQTTASATDMETKETEELKPNLEAIQEILNVVNENLIAIDIPKFDYNRLSEIIKKNLRITVSGGGSANTQYAEGAVPDEITGTVAMGENSGSILPIQVDSTGKLGIVFIDENGVFTPIQMDGNKQRVMSQPYQYGMATGDIANHVPGHVPGINDSVGATLADISELGVATIPQPSTAISMEVVSTSTDDDGDPAGTGVQIIEIHGLDNNYNEIEEQITLNGTTVVPTTLQYLRINELHAVATGTGGSAAGIISLQSVGGATEYSRISLGKTTAMQCHYTVPNERICVVSGWSGSADGVTRFYLMGTAHGPSREITINSYLVQETMIRDSNGGSDELMQPIRFPSQADIKISGESLLGSNTKSAVGFEYFIEPTETAISYLLTEAGDFLLQEDGFKLIL